MRLKKLHLYGLDSYPTSDTIAPMVEDPEAFKQQQMQEALEEATSALESVHETISDLDANALTVVEWQRASAQVGILLSQFDRASSQVNQLLGLGGAQNRLLTYLRSRVGEPVRMEELRGVAAIYEWARRLRELRVEKGWPIVTDVQRRDLMSGQYLLEYDHPDTQVARDWQLAKDMRNLKVNGKPASGKTRGLEYLKALSPRAADKDQLNYVMKIPSGPRRLRELEEEGWRIISNVDDPTLAPGSYRLESLVRRPPRVRQAIKLRHEILDRDMYRCQDCGRTPDRDAVTLQVHHLRFVSHGGSNEPANLITLCADCHAGRHALAHGATKDELLSPEWLEESAPAKGDPTPD